MGARRKKVAGVAALSVTALATVMGAQPAAADELVCVTGCDIVVGPGDGPFHKDNAAFYKFADPGSVFHKVDGSFYKFQPESPFYKDSPGQLNAFLKLGELGFPGNTRDVFLKHAPNAVE